MVFFTCQWNVDMKFMQVLIRRTRIASAEIAVTYQLYVEVKRNRRYQLTHHWYKTRILGIKKQKQFGIFKKLCKFQFQRPTAKIQQCKLQKQGQVEILTTSSTQRGRGRKQYLNTTKKSTTKKVRKLNF